MTYSDGSISNLTYSYNRQGQVTSIAQSGANVLTRTYSDVGMLLAETDINGVIVSNRYDSFLRRTNVTILTGSASIGFGYSFDAAGRLATASQPALFGNQPISATYSYLTNSPLVSQIDLKENGSTRLTTTKTYDLLNRLTGISSSSSGGGLFQFNYAYNSANQRIAVTNADRSTWVWQYDNLGQVKSAKQSWSNAAPVAGRQMEYAFDDIGNRTSTKVGGDTAGANQRTASYTVNSLNQYTARTVPSSVEIQGAATNNATVLVNGQTAMRQGDYFRAELAVDNSAPLWLSVTNLGLLVQGTNVLAAATTGHQLIPPATQAFTHDADGNQLTDGLWTNTWNAENRVMTTESVNTLLAPARRRETWSYLPDGRWSQRVIATNNGTAYFPAATNRYVWDGKVLLAVLDHTNGVVMTFLRGLDMSDSMQGAGGVGGVLAVSFETNGTHFDAYDGNGNVAGLVAASNATVTATYEYAAFGEILRATGPAATLNPIRFSTQYADDVTENVKYLYRDHSARDGRWSSRDPIEEDGGINYYSFINNSSVNSVDLLGLVIESCDADKYFDDNGLKGLYTKTTLTKGNSYSIKPGASGPASGTGFIIWRMLLTKHVFKAKDLDIDNLKKNIAAREFIIKNAMAKKFTFSTKPKVMNHTIFPIPNQLTDPQKFFESINNNGTSLACEAATKIIMESGNLCNGWDIRNFDGVWIPGDWVYIKNTAFVPGVWGPGFEGENLITTFDRFWGHIETPVFNYTEKEWFDYIRSWPAKRGMGKPQWDDERKIRGPKIGLE